MVELLCRWHIFVAEQTALCHGKDLVPKAQFPSAEYADCARGITRLVNAALARACSIVGAGFAGSYQPNLSEGSVSAAVGTFFY